MSQRGDTAEVMAPLARPKRRYYLDTKQLHFINIFMANPGMALHEVARLAGYGPNANEVTLKNMAQRARRHPAVALEIARRQERVARRTGSTLERHIDELSRIAYSDMADFLPVLDADDPLAAMRELPADSTAAVRKVKFTELADGARRIEIDLWDKNDALKSIAGHLGMRRPAAFFVPGAEGGQGGPIDGGERQVTMRSMLRCLSPKQLAAWRDIVETIQRAARENTPLLENHSDPETPSEEGEDAQHLVSNPDDDEVSGE